MEKDAFSEEINQNTLIDLDTEGRIFPLEIYDVSSFLDEELLPRS